MPKSEVYNCDCMTFMQGLEDNAFDLCIADPPYGIDVTRMTLGSGRHKFSRGKSDWYIATPDKRFFNEMFRISKNQIIWGGNYFDLPTCDDWIVWDKLNPNLSFAEGELAWCSVHRKVRIYKHYSAMIDGGSKIHPTQKPIALYEWLIKNYAPQGGGNLRPNDGQSVEPHCGMANGV